MFRGLSDDPGSVPDGRGSVRFYFLGGHPPKNKGGIPTIKIDLESGSGGTINDPKTLTERKNK